MLETFSDFLQLVGYVAGPIALGALLFYGIRKSNLGKNRAAQDIQDRSTKRLYEREEDQRQAQAKAAEHSSNPIDVIERKTDTTG
jgi:hypothetical protein